MKTKVIVLLSLLLVTLLIFLGFQTVLSEGTRTSAANRSASPTTKPASEDRTPKPPSSSKAPLNQSTKEYREKKADLIHLIQELTAVSPTVQHFLHARYLHTRDTVARIQPYLKRIDAQFEGEETWSDLGQIAQAIQEYQLATQKEPDGTTELYVYALEATAGFFWGIGIHDMDLLSDVAELAWQCVSHFNEFPPLYP